MEDWVDQSMMVGDSRLFALWTTGVVFHNRVAAGRTVWMSQDVLLRLWDKSETRSKTSRSLCISFWTFSMAYITVV